MGTGKKQARGPLGERQAQYKSRYGVTTDMANHLLHDVQGGGCGVCERPLSFTDRRTHVDHCHISGNVRGVLCALCNQGLGMLGDTPESLQRALSYLNDPPAERADESHWTESFEHWRRGG